MSPLIPTVDDVQHSRLCPACATHINVAEEVQTSQEAKAILAKIADAHKQGEAPLKAREEATLHVARISLRIQTWKEDANGVRRSVENKLDAHANDHGLPRDYSDPFFLSSRAAKSSAGKGAGTPAPTVPSGG